MSQPPSRPLILLSLLLCTNGCLDVAANGAIVDSTSHPGDGKTGGDGPRSQTDGALGGAISIYVAGDLSKVAFNDGLAGQTPYDYEIALSRYHVLLSAADPSPTLCFDHGTAPFVASISKDNLVGSCQTQTIKAGAYTHGRTKVDWARYTVDGVYHYLGQQLPGKLTFFRAYSDVTVNGKPYKAGEGTIAFSGLTTVEIPVTYPPLPPMPGIKTEVVSGELLMTFSYSKPLPIDPADARPHWARFHWKIFESFRWADEPLLGYTTATWDVAPVSSESVKLHGVSGYYTTSSVD
jgi:hypothetical protein